MKKQLFLIMLLILQGFIVFIPTDIVRADPYGGNIVGDTVYWENSYANLSVYPHTSTGFVRQYQWANLTWKEADNTIDVAFRFNNSLSYGKIWRWNGASWVQVTMQHTTYNNRHYYYYQGFNVVQDTTYRFKWEYDIPANTSGKWDLFAKLNQHTIQQALDNDWYVMLDPWWNSNWNYRRTITIDNNYIDTDLVNFTVFVPLSNDIVSKSNNGDSIRFVGNDNLTVYSHEIDKWNGTGTSYAWVKIPSVSSSTLTKFNLYYGNPVASSVANNPDTWDDNFVGVWHLSNTSRIDSKGNRDLGENGNPVHDDDYGIIDGTYDWDSVDDALTNASLSGFPTGNRTVEIWAYADDYPSKVGTYDNGLWSELGSSTAGCFMAVSESNTKINYIVRDSNGDEAHADAGVVTDTWYYAVLVWNAHTHTVTGYINDTSMDTDTDVTVGAVDTNNELFIGDHAVAGSREWDGHLDEIRISDTTRNASWVKASFHSINRTTGFLSLGSEEENPSDLFPPTNFEINTTSDSEMTLTWTMGVNATHTHIRRSTTSYPNVITEGTFVYNGTSTTANVIDLSAMTVYYYSAWSYNSTTGNFSLARATGTNHTGPANPTNVGTVLSGSYINVSWVKGARADDTALIRKATGFPSSPTDGTEIYNSTGTYYNDTSFSGGYYRLYSFNNTTGLFSTGINVQYGQLVINVYDENTSNAITNWDVFITNESGTETYESTGNTNPLTIDISNLPNGANVAIKINATNYDFRLYYMDIYANNQYTLDAYLAPENITELYLLTVVDEVDNPVSDATIQIQQYINETVGYENVSIRLTDANGQVIVYLIPGSYNSLYKIIINKEGYQEEIVDYVPSDLIFTHTFRLDFAEITQPDPYIESEEITFEGYISGTTLYINYTDNLEQTLNSQIYIYVVNYSTLTTTLHTYNTATTSNDYQITTTINTSNAHIAYLHYNHTTFGYITHSLFFEATNTTTFTNQTYFDELFELNYGTNPFGWSNVFMFLFLTGCFFSFGQRGSGISLMFTGGLMLFINNIIGFNTTLAVAAGGGIPIFFVIVGIMVLWRNAKKEGYS